MPRAVSAKHFYTLVKLNTTFCKGAFWDNAQELVKKCTIRFMGNVNVLKSDISSRGNHIYVWAWLVSCIRLWLAYGKLSSLHDLVDCFCFFSIYLFFIPSMTNTVTQAKVKACLEAGKYRCTQEGHELTRGERSVLTSGFGFTLWESLDFSLLQAHCSVKWKNVLVTAMLT